MGLAELVEGAGLAAVGMAAEEEGFVEDQHAALLQTGAHVLEGATFVGSPTLRTVGEGPADALGHTLVLRAELALACAVMLGLVVVAQAVEGVEAEEAAIARAPLALRSRSAAHGGFRLRRMGTSPDVRASAAGRPPPRPVAV
ncbi:hypothetical protein FSW04_22520 [Baekduia soli]|uniref:Uncharacterized protein n=1 Tax=Baekduia soli TaxID=496014 RepID=A0A5B8UAH9_9ACTN|nr:hypothetical protein [Baekduia soli]QEC50070.1 hypothetical protein FSW04_22520 [Baekduia soli]